MDGITLDKAFLYDREKYHKSTFERIPQIRRDKIIKTATEEFANKGFNGASINEIAKKSGISIGSMYSYFSSKEDLYLSLMDIGCSVIKEVFEAIDTEMPIFDVIEELLRSTREYSLTYPELNQIYLDLTTQSISKFSRIISKKLEETTSKVYKELIKKAKLRGEISTDVKDGLIALFLDNLVVTYQFSLSSNYYRERMKIYLNEYCEDDKEVRKGLLNLIKNSLRDK